jgi:hypothetical protein
MAKQDHIEVAAFEILNRLFDGVRIDQDVSGGFPKRVLICQEPRVQPNSKNDSCAHTASPQIQVQYRLEKFQAYFACVLRKYTLFGVAEVIYVTPVVVTG